MRPVQVALLKQSGKSDNSTVSVLFNTVAKLVNQYDLVLWHSSFDTLGKKLAVVVATFVEELLTNFLLVLLNNFALAGRSVEHRLLRGASPRGAVGLLVEVTRCDKWVSLRSLSRATDLLLLPVDHSWFGRSNGISLLAIVVS